MSLTKSALQGALVGLFLAGLIALGTVIGPTRTRVVHPPTRSETIYIQNESPRYMSDKAILRDIPAWQRAANKDFAPAWRTPQVKLMLLHGKAPKGAIIATFKTNGPVNGALAFHGVARGTPYIVVYTGVGDFYGYSNSVSFTHELEEMLADETVSHFDWSYFNPYPNYYVGKKAYKQPGQSFWFNEVSDPVEAYSYRIDGVAISDFITPNWFNDEVAGGYDFMGVIQRPFTVSRGGYAQFIANGQLYAILNFRHAGRDASGFYKGEQGLR